MDNSVSAYTLRQLLTVMAEKDEEFTQERLRLGIIQSNSAKVQKYQRRMIHRLIESNHPEMRRRDNSFQGAFAVAKAVGYADTTARVFANRLRQFEQWALDRGMLGKRRFRIGRSTARAHHPLTDDDIDALFERAKDVESETMLGLMLTVGYIRPLVSALPGNITSNDGFVTICLDTERGTRTYHLDAALSHNVRKLLRRGYLFRRPDQTVESAYARFRYLFHKRFGDVDLGGGKRPIPRDVLAVGRRYRKGMMGMHIHPIRVKDGFLL